MILLDPDPYHSFDTDTDQDLAQLLIWIRIQGNDSDRADPDPQHFSA